MGLVEALITAKGPETATNLAKITGADKLLVGMSKSDREHRSFDKPND